MPGEPYEFSGGKYRLNEEVKYVLGNTFQKCVLNWDESELLADSYAIIRLNGINKEHMLPLYRKVGAILCPRMKWRLWLELQKPQGVLFLR